MRKTITGCQEKKCKKGECGISADMKEGPLMWPERETRTLIGRRGRAPDAAEDGGPLMRQGEGPDVA